MQLLVSVATAADAVAAVEGGADIVDAKDPLVGALGAVTPEVFRAIAAVTLGVRPLSAALGEPRDQREAAHLAATFASAGAVFVKLGFRRDVSSATMTSLLTSARDASDAQVVAVAYADVGGAGARRRVLDAAASVRVSGVLLDTARKDGPGLCDACSPDDLAAWVADVSAAGLLTALAGRLTRADIEQVSGFGVSIVGVRGAACEGGRTGHVSGRRVRDLRAVCAIAQPRASALHV